MQLDETLQLNQFDPSLGTLTDVTFNLTSDLAVRLFVAGFSTPLASPVHGLASSDYSLSLTDLFIGALFEKSFHNEAECFLADRLLCTDTDTEHAGEGYDDTFDALPLAGYQGLGNYDVTLSQQIDMAVGGSGGESGFVGGWFGDLQVVYAYSTVPVPAAVWLFGSGLIGLISIAKRKKA